ncbi:hypothetical protein CHCC20442_1407 [Bacillus licheniformis]|nr:hypothetical protein S100141_04898 [Bacillus licheniformis]TWK10953.1 hypothetical protein CHCC20442_1407 [Bacillus licheniformis]TWN01042.1 hypothetical protein CHCC14566_0263 [Bacillus licheniformis]
MTYNICAFMFIIFCLSGQLYFIPLLLVVLALREMLERYFKTKEKR